MKLYLARHAQPLWEPNGRAVDDPHLTDSGYEQAEALADRLEGLEFDHFLVSPTTRSRETAAPLEKRWGRRAQVLDWLEEIRTPPLEGTLESTVRAFLEEARARPLADWWQGLAGGEAFNDFHQRVVRGLERFLSDELDIRPHGMPHLWEQRSPPQKILVVSHLGTSSVILSHLLGLTPVPWEWERFPLAWAALAIVRTIPLADGHLWALKEFTGSSGGVTKPGAVTR